MGDRLTLLRCAQSLVLTKTWKADGSIVPYSSAKHFSLERLEVDGVHALAEAFERLQHDPRICLIRGAPKEPTEKSVRRLAENFDDAPLHTLLIEIDKYQPLLSDPVIDTEAAILEYVSECLPAAFHDASFWWQASSSAGAPGKDHLLKAHAWFWSETAYDSATLKAWAKAEDMQLDPSVFQVVQLNFIAAPVIEPGAKCPVIKRSGFYQGVRDAAPLAIDVEVLNVRRRAERRRGERLDVEDPLADWLQANWETWGSLANGGLKVTCPFAEGHSTGVSGDSSTVYFPAGSNGYASGMWVCKHAHCEDRDQESFRRACGWAEQRLGAFAERLPVEHKSQTEVPGWCDSDPLDLWRSPEPSPLPEFVLPAIIDRFARIQAECMGVDAGGLATAALAVCAAAIPDHIQLQVKEHDRHWRESARLWIGLVGLPSTKKSPLIATTARPLRKAEARLRREYALAMAAYDELSAEDRKAKAPPLCPQLILEDATIEAAQEVFARTPNGLLCLQDELSGWFGGMDKYGGAKGAAKDRAFWLQAYNGGPCTVNRVARGNVHIENVSASLLGGIQPDPIRRAIAEAHDDGLIQRLIPIVLQRGHVGRDEPQSDVIGEYEMTVDHLQRLSTSTFEGGFLRFAPRAQEVQRRLTARHHELLQVEALNPKLASHFGKYDGVFARLCVVFHCLENSEAQSLPPLVSEDTAERAGRLLHGFLLPHAVAFYTAVLGLSDDQELLRDIAGHILTHEKSEIGTRDLQRGSRSMKALTRDEGKKTFERLEACGWLQPKPERSFSASRRWLVNPAVHTIFAARAQIEAERRAGVRRVLAELAG